MDAWIAWWAVSTLLGVIALPYCSAALGNLPDRGWCLARPLGLLLTSYALWLAGVLGLLPNGRGAVLLCVALVAAGGLLLVRGQREGLRALITQNRRPLLAYEALFLAAFATMAMLRSFVPELNSTEKPMDLAMLNSVMRSPTLPPLDPWLAGYTVNYYYFGYLMMGVLSQLAGTTAAVGFNLALAYTYATAAVAALGLVANLVVLFSGSGMATRLTGPALRAGLLASVTLLVAGNALGALEFLRAHGVALPDLWRWLSIKHGDDGAGRLVMLGLPPDQPYQSAAWYPTENWWWWRSTRLVDSVVNGRSTDYTITEFPFFSFLLGDLHPHVMALPFGLLALGVCLAAFYRTADARIWLREHRLQLGVTALVLGSLGFINGWDLGPYLALFFGAVAVRTWVDYGASARAWMQLVGWGAGLGAAMLAAFGVFYLPLLAQVAGSGAGGEGGGFPIALWQGPNTRPLHMLLFWLATIPLCAGFLVVAAPQSLGRLGRLSMFGLACLLVLLAGNELWRLLNPAAAPEANPFRFMERWWLLGPLALALGVALSRPPAGSVTENLPGVHNPPSTAPPDAVRFVAGLLAAALTLLLVCELVFVRDVFGNRMNTVFKLWYQAWTWLAIAGAAGLAYVRLMASPWARTAWTTVGLVAVVLTCLYAVIAAPARTNGFSGTPTLDGLAYLKQTEPGELEALTWMAGRPSRGEVVLEATGGQYSFFGRVATASGIPTVLGWAGHERQWRGSDAAFRDRAADIDAIFNAEDKDQVQGLLAKYGVTYVYVGSLEKAKYAKNALDAFGAKFPAPYQNQSVTIYRVQPN